MKGKGKGKEILERECPLQFPDFSLVDKTRICPRITSVLARTEEEGVALEDLDVIQLELETLLTSVNKRKHLVQEEMQILISHEKKDKKFTTGKGQPELPVKRGKSNDDRPSKKFKDSLAIKPTHLTPVATPRPVKNKNMHINNDNDVTDSKDPRKQPENDVPIRFWNSVEPYCADVTEEHIKFLEELITQHEDDADYHKIPALGKHYSLKWAQEDLLEEQKEGSKSADKKKGLTNGTNFNSESEKMLKKAEKECNSDDNASYSALTQHLVSCLMEENLFTPVDDIMMDSSAKDANESNTNGVKGGFIKSLNIANASTLERRIRKELEEHGFLEVDELQSSNSEDEVLAELKKCQAELKTICKANIEKTKGLLKQAKELQIKQELKHKLALADVEVRDVYRKLQSIKQKKKIPTKKEKDQAWKAIRERANIIKLLDEK